MQLLTLAGSLLFVIYSVAVQGTENVGPCTKAKLGGGDDGKVGKYIPQCTEFGFFKPIQCDGSIGICWCANPDDGKAVEGTAVYHSSEVIKCPMCIMKRADALRVDSMVGGYVPQCDEHGLFTPTQIYGAIGHSWCVDPETGNEIDGTRKKSPEHADGCDALVVKPPSSLVQFSTEPKGPCHVEQQQNNHKYGSFAPMCTEHGYYITEQRHGSTGYKWCVNPITGVEVEGTRRGPTQDKATCGPCFKEIQDKITTKPMLGNELPKCNEKNGNFMPLQFREGYRYCVNPKSGSLVGKIYPPGDKSTLPCYAIN